MAEATTVYIVNVFLKETPNSHPDIAGVFSTLELAKARIPTAKWYPSYLGTGWYDANDAGLYGPRIEPYILDGDAL
jgi:hypothetical protein